MATRKKSLGSANGLQPYASQARTTGELARIIRAMQHDAVYRRNELVINGRVLAQSYRDHLDREEGCFFPVVEQNFVPADWADIDER